MTDDWEREPASAYTTSTLGKSLADEGFVHCSFRSQVQQIADLVYRGRSDVLLLEIDPDRLTAPVRVESLDLGGDQFPHVYGPINRDAVLKVTRLTLLPSGRLDVEELQ